MTKFAYNNKKNVNTNQTSFETIIPIFPLRIKQILAQSST